jgi:transposase InsO family protein
MGKKRFPEEPIAFALWQAESGTSVAEVIRKLGISQQTFYRWKKRFAGFEIWRRAGRTQGYQRLWILLRREGWLANKKLVYPLYCKEGLGIRRRKSRRRKSVQVREARPPTGQTNDSWGMEFMSDQLVGGERFRLLMFVDNHSRESLGIEVGQPLTGDDVVRVLEQVTVQRGKPKTSRGDNGPELISRSLDRWAYFNGVKATSAGRESPRIT